MFSVCISYDRNTDTHLDAANSLTIQLFEQPFHLRSITTALALLLFDITLFSQPSLQLHIRALQLAVGDSVAFVDVVELFYSRRLFDIVGRRTLLVAIVQLNNCNFTIV